MTNHDVEHAIRKRMSGDVRDAFLAIGQCSAGAPSEQASPEGRRPLHLPLPRQRGWQIPAAFGPWTLPAWRGVGAFIGHSVGPSLHPHTKEGVAADPMGGRAPGCDLSPGCCKPGVHFLSLLCCSPECEEQAGLLR